MKKEIKVVKSKMDLKETKETVLNHAKKAHGLMTEFKAFLSEYKILGIASGLVIGSAITTFVQSIVVGLVTPALQMLIPSEGWKSLVFEVNGAKFQVGLVLSASINFLAVALLFFLFVKAFLKTKKVEKI